MKNILIMTFLLLSVVKADFIRDDIKEVVSDTETCLIWQDNATTVGKLWQEAIEYCEDLNFAGYSNWRLPNFNELYSIGDRDMYNPSIKDAFSNVVSFRYWSSTTDINSIDLAWVVDFNNGNGIWSDKRSSEYVRCVRAGQ